jgi:polyisoprenoid-binding protein YceI
MKKVYMILAVLAISLSAFKTIPPATWSFDPAHSKLGFSISYLMVSDVEGSFQIKEATITTPKEDFTDASVTLVADVNTVSTENEKRDEHLKNPDFFDAAKFPTLTFKSTSFKKVSDKKYEVTGDLTLHGVTKPVTLEAVATVSYHPYMKKDVAGFRVTGVVKRSDFGISTGTPTTMLSDEVTLDANVVFAKN